MQQDVQVCEYLLDSLFFTNIGSEDIQKGKVNVQIAISKKAGVFDLSFTFGGIVVIPCDRCLDDMDLPIETTAHLVVKLGKDYSEESDEIVVIPEMEGKINLAWFLYEFIALAIPIKHVHAPGKCNKTMTSKLKKHSPKGSGEKDDDFDSVGADEDIIITDEEDRDSMDPRWGTLKDLIDDNND